MSLPSLRRASSSDAGHPHPLGVGGSDGNAGVLPGQELRKPPSPSPLTPSFCRAYNGGMKGIRITGGRLKGRRVAGGRDRGTRHTSAKVREAVFDVAGDVEGAFVLDLFAGTGSFAIEALSRAAASVTAVERDRRTASLLRGNLRDLALDKDCLVLDMEVRYAVPMLYEQGRRFDLIFVDPPYEMGYVASTLELLEKHPLYRDGSMIVFEHSKREGLGASPGRGREVESRRYGDTVLTVIRTAGRRAHPA